MLCVSVFVCFYLIVDFFLCVVLVVKRGVAMSLLDLVGVGVDVRVA